MHEVDRPGVEEEVKRLTEGGADIGPGAMPARGAQGNIDILDGGISVGQFQNEDGTWVPTLVVNIAFAIRVGREGAEKMAEALAESAGKKAIIRPHMTVVKGA